MVKGKTVSNYSISGTVVSQKLFIYLEIFEFTFNETVVYLLVIKYFFSKSREKYFFFIFIATSDIKIIKTILSKY